MHCICYTKHYFGKGKTTQKPEKQIRTNIISLYFTIKLFKSSIFIQMPVPSQESVQSMKGVKIPNEVNRR
jgi:hypothetical protein